MEWNMAGSLKLTKAIVLLRNIISQRPLPEAKSEIAREASEGIGLHLVNLVLGACQANMSGFHSCALALFRPMEDALDCLAAVSISPEAAERWTSGKLKASDAAKLWQDKLGEVKLPTGDTTCEYRKGLRQFLNDFAHCAPCLV